VTDPVNAVPTLPVNPPKTGTIDITNTIEAMRSTWVSWSTTYVQSCITLIPYGIGPMLSTWPLRSIIKWGLTLALNTISKSAVMGAFFLNTAIRKASQAQDYVDAINAKNALPPTASDAEYQKAEQAEMATFRNFVMVSN
jgi:hypothetical protein